jgi:hypothetical protein
MKDINDIWGFIEEHYEDYYSSDAVFEHNTLTKFIEGEDVYEEDIKWIKSNFKSADEIRDRLKVITIKLTCEAIMTYYEKLFKEISEKVEKRLKK